MALEGQVLAHAQFFGAEETVSASSRALLAEEVDLIENRSGVVILELGSYNLRFGYAEAEERRPASIVNCVAYRRDLCLSSEPNPLAPTSQAAQTTTQTSSSAGNGPSSNTMEVDADSGAVKDESTETPTWHLELAQLEFDYNLEVAELQRSSRSGSVRFVSAENCVESVPEDPNAPTEWANVSDFPDSIIGDAALYLDDDDNYDIFFPIRNGRFNTDCVHMTAISREQRYDITQTVVTDALERIWRHAVFDKLGIATDSIRTYDVLLVLPDSFVPREVQLMIDILIQRIGFGHIMLQKSSVCAALGAGKNGVCVVNVGFNHTTVACIDDLEVLPGSSFTTLVGGLDVSKCLKALLAKEASNLHYKYLAANIDESIQDLIIFEEMKETCCHLNPSSIQPKTYEFLVRHRNQSESTLYRHSIGMAQFFAPMVICFPNLEEKRREKFEHMLLLSTRDKTKSHQSEYDSNDPFGLTFHKSLQVAQGSRSRLPNDAKSAIATAGVKDEKTEDDLVDDLGETRLRLSIPDSSTQHDDVDLSLPHLIVAAITSASSNQRVQSRLFSQILLVGGSANIENLTQLIVTEVQSLVPESMSGVIHASLPQHALDPTNCVWNGASLLVSNTPREFWLDRISWRTHGLLALREKLMFSWDNPDNRKLK